MQDVRGGDAHLALPAHRSIMSGDVSLDFMWRWLDEQLDMFLGCARLSGCAILFRAVSRSAVYNGVCMHNPLPPPTPSFSHSCCSILITTTSELPRAHLSSCLRGRNGCNMIVGVGVRRAAPPTPTKSAQRTLSRAQDGQVSLHQWR